jgi:hypothetical protein
MQERFWPKVRKTNGCWEWVGARWQGKFKELRYGKFSVDGRPRPAHRISWELNRGPIPEGMLVLHRCDNQGCVRPDHLYLGTHADNTRDAIERNRMCHGERIWTHKLTAKDVPLIRAMAAAGVSAEKIGPHFGVVGRTVRYILEGRSWKHV